MYLKTLIAITALSISSTVFAVDNATITSIANGHAYQKHVIEKKEYPEITSKAQFFSLIKAIVSNPTASKPLPRSRTAYWGDSTKTIVIIDPSHIDKGTAFRTTKAYYDAQTDIDNTTN